jgi:TRAP-type mannitol/chloroaromatic compound transport system permease large subunit
VPIFLPLLEKFAVDPILFGVLVALNIQTSFNTPPMAMAAYYLKGISPPNVQLVQIFAGSLPFVLIVIMCMVFIYAFPGIALWLPDYLYSSR